MEINNKHRSCIIFPLKDSGSLTSHRESHNHHHHSPHKQELPNSINSIKHCHGNPTSIVFPCYRQDEKIYSSPKQMHLKNAISEIQPFLTIGDAFTLRVCQVGPAYATSQLCCSHIYPWSWFSPWFWPESRPVAFLAWPQTQLIPIVLLGNHWMVCDANYSLQTQFLFCCPNFPVSHCCYGLDRCQHQHCSVQSDTRGQVPRWWVLPLSAW